ATGAEIETGADETLDPAPSAGSQTTTEADPGADPDADADADGADGATTELDGLRPVPGAQLRELAVTEIRANPRQPRLVFDDDALRELTHSVREFGVLQPIVVRQVETGYELVMGERRLRAATAAGLETVPAIVRETGDDAMLRDALLENIHRAQLNPLEEAAAYQQLLEEFGVTHEELATRIGRSRSHLSNTVRLMNLSVPVQRRVAAGVLSAGHARALLALTDGEAQDDLATRIVAEGLSVRATEELVTLTVNGHLSGAARRRPIRRFTAPAATDLADKLSDAFDTKVRVDIGKRKGKITVEFASIDDLERIVAVMAPGLSSRRTTPETVDQPLAAPVADQAVGETGSAQR
ncbi:MAG: parB, partial [Pseudonocardiales bacterium]|nr:parB [Pseudonocardiales bacterium]